MQTWIIPECRPGLYLNADLDYTPRTIEYSILNTKVKHQAFLERTENFSNLYLCYKIAKLSARDGERHFVFFLIAKFQISYWTDTLNK